MFLREIDTTTNPPVPPPAVDVSLSLEHQVQNGLNLILPLKNPAQMPALMAAIAAAKPRVYQALTDLHYIHFARFLPMPDGSSLLVVTSYDGDLDSYIMDFVAVLGDVFTEILTYVRDASSAAGDGLSGRVRAIRARPQRLPGRRVVRLSRPHAHRHPDATRP